MIAELIQETELTLCDGVVMSITAPTPPTTPDEAELLVRQLRAEGWFCGIIYCYRDIISGKKYIGQTVSPKKRHLEHFRSSRHKVPCSVFGKAIKKHGANRFNYRVLEVIKCKSKIELKLELDEREQFHIAWRHSKTDRYGYNVSSGGSMWGSSEANRKKVDMFDLQGNYIRTYESLRAANDDFGFWAPITIRHACNHVQATAGGYIWAWHGEKPVIPSNPNRVYAYDTDGKFVGEYESGPDAYRKLGICSVSINKAIHTKRLLAGGYYWRSYKEDVLPLSDCPDAVYAYDMDGNFIKGFTSLRKAAEYIGDKNTSSLSHAIISRPSRKGLQWKREYFPKIAPIKKKHSRTTSVMVTYPNGKSQTFDTIIEAHKSIGISKTAIYKALKDRTPTKEGFLIIRKSNKSNTKELCL